MDDGRASYDDVRDFDAVARFKDFLFCRPRTSRERLPPRDLARRLDAMLDRWEATEPGASKEES
jgi:hypothetical protein